MRFKHLPIFLAAAIASGCSDGAVAPTAETDGLAIQASVGGVIHRATVGGPDICSGTGGSPGCDANFSLVALQFSDGSVSGQWHDQFSQANGGGGIHVTINCLAVVGNEAWVSGVGPEHPWGNEWVTRVRDNGVTANDPADQIGLTVPVGQPNPRLSGGIRQNCSATQDLRTFDAPEGQVVVR
jgi:hypothetical protein